MSNHLSNPLSTNPGTALQPAPHRSGLKATVAAAALGLALVGATVVAPVDPAHASVTNGYYTVEMDYSGPDGTVVRVTPITDGTGFDPRDSAEVQYEKYTELVSSTYEGSKYRDQLICHVANAGTFKTPWNLDSWRPDVGYAATVAALCNP